MMISFVSTTIYLIIILSLVIDHIYIFIFIYHKSAHIMDDIIISSSQMRATKIRPIKNATNNAHLIKRISNFILRSLL